jgi:hypothetical protein
MARLLSEFGASMPKKISLQDLQALYEDPSVSNTVLREYILGASEKSRPFSPGLIPDPSKVDTGISGTDTEVRAALVGDLVLGWERERRRRQFEEDIVKRPELQILYFEGDSWCQFPLFLDELYDQLRQSFNIYCTSRAGDTIRNMINKRPEYLKYLHELIHLRGLTLNGFIFSGAGNDVVGKGKSGKPVLEEILKPFDPNQPPEWHIETPECDEIMDYIANGYRKLFDSVEERFEIAAYPELKIYIHGYDYVQVRSLPNKDPDRKPWAENWTGDPLRAKGFLDNETGSSVIRALINRLNITTKKVCSAYPDRAVYVDLRGSVPPNEWADELHATSVGFHKAAQAFISYLPRPNP